MFPTSPTMPTDTNDKNNVSLVEDVNGVKTYILLLNSVPFPALGESLVEEMVVRLVRCVSARHTIKSNLR